MGTDTRKELIRRRARVIVCIILGTIVGVGVLEIIIRLLIPLTKLFS